MRHALAVEGDCPESRLAQHCGGTDVRAGSRTSRADRQRSTRTRAHEQNHGLKVHSRCDLAYDHCYMYEAADQGWRLQPGSGCDRKPDRPPRTKIGPVTGHAYRTSRLFGLRGAFSG